MNIFYFTLLIFLVMSPQAFSNQKCQNSFEPRGSLKEVIEALKSNKTVPPLAYRILTKREERIVRMRRGIGEETPHTFTAIAKLFNLSPAREYVKST